VFSQKEFQIQFGFFLKKFPASALDFRKLGFSETGEFPGFLEFFLEISSFFVELSKYVEFIHLRGTHLGAVLDQSEGS